MRAVYLILCVAIGFSGCTLFYPKKIVHNNLAPNNKACEIIHKELVLDKVTFGKVSDWLQFSSLSGCNGEDCVALLILPAIAAASTAGTFVVSGSIVVTGNVVYWLEKKVGCAHNGENHIEQMGKEPVPESKTGSDF
ncbi:MAG: hypothetical protein HY037_04620 [Nitrospirae bacterium]|nr:hypothetical protein [Candidatus Troglogloeales bacterium]